MIVLLFIFALFVLVITWLSSLQIDRQQTYQLQAADIPVRGDGPVQVDVYADFSCQYCGHLAAELDEVFAEYPTAMTERFWYVPRTDGSTVIAAAAACAHQQDGFWQYQQQLFSVDQLSSVAQLNQAAEAVGLDTVAFSDCLDSLETLPVVTASLQAAFDRSVQHVPTIFINDQAVPWQSAATTIKQRALGIIE